MLFVPLGERGLRQSDAVFQHVRNLPPLIEAMLSSVDRGAIQAVAVSCKPTAADESYMPVFLAGKLAAVSVASSLGVPVFETTHQSGHVRAAILGQEELFGEETFLAMHLSGGTTDLLLVRQENGLLGDITRIGGCDDLHAGQFVDRVGVRLGLPFPSGIKLEELANSAQDRSIKLPASVRGLNCSFSGQETQCQRMIEGGAEREAVAYAVYDCMARTFAKLLTNAFAETGVKTALLSGGVSGSLLLRELLQKRLNRELLYAQKGLSSDNAVGAALLARDLYNHQSR
ncbi:MAG: O-sialoglycoprotein endopeptidase [Firmicutes bacterium HGW-Firmicutes-9]|nr:MAG: O-sialoglycoprotein endopeptidase [Firmicutes bacterium HGW-Firmicutes-9]